MVMALLSLPLVGPVLDDQSRRKSPSDRTCGAVSFDDRLVRRLSLASFDLGLPAARAD
jgi:hypothetical protein